MFSWLMIEGLIQLKSIKVLLKCGLIPADPIQFDTDVIVFVLLIMIFGFDASSPLIQEKFPRQETRRFYLKIPLVECSLSVF